jgi:hypothetical protein
VREFVVSAGSRALEVRVGWRDSRKLVG